MVYYIILATLFILGITGFCSTIISINYKFTQLNIFVCNARKPLNTFYVKDYIPIYIAIHVIVCIFMQYNE